MPDSGPLFQESAFFERAMAMSTFSRAIQLREKDASQGTRYISSDVRTMLRGWELSTNDVATIRHFLNLHASSSYSFYLFLLGQIVDPFGGVLVA